MFGTFRETQIIGYAYDDGVIASTMKDIDFLLRYFYLLGEISKTLDKTKIVLM